MSSKEQYYRKIILMLIVLFMCFSLGFLFFLKRHEVTSVPYVFKDSIVQSSGYQYRIDHLEEYSDEIAIGGWLIRKGTKIETIERQMVLKEKNGKESLLLATEIIPRDNLTLKEDDGVDYTLSGIYARVYKADLKDDVEYDLYVLDEVNEISVLVPLNMTIKEGEIK